MGGCKWVEMSRCSIPECSSQKSHWLPFPSSNGTSIRDIGKMETNWEFSQEHGWFGVYWYLSSRCQKELFFFFKQMSSLFVVLPLFCPQKGHVSRCTGRGSIMPCSVSVFVLCSCVCVHACVCMGLCVRACAAQPASSANAPWKTNSVSVDSISRQRSSSDPPAVHPPLPPLRVTSTSTFFFSFYLSCRRASYYTDGWWGVGGWSSRPPRGEQAPACTLLGAPPWPPPCGPLLPGSWPLSVPLPTGSTPTLLCLQALQQRFFLSHVGAGLPLAVPCFGVPACVPVD